MVEEKSSAGELILVNQFLEKFGIRAGKIEVCSPLVRDWVPRLQAATYFVPLQNKMIAYADSMIADIDAHVASKSSSPDEKTLKEIAFYRDQQRMFVNARNYMMRDPTASTVRELHEMLVAGAQTAHQALPKEPVMQGSKKTKQERIPDVPLPVIRVRDDIKNEVIKNIMAKLHFSQMEMDQGSGKKLYGIGISPNAIISLASNKERMRNNDPVLTDQDMKERCAHYLRAGAEEYYHVFQSSHAPTAARLERESRAHYKTPNYEAERQRLQHEMAAIEAVDKELFRQRSDDYHRTDPAEKDAARVLDPLAAKHAQMADAYYSSRQKGGPP